MLRRYLRDQLFAWFGKIMAHDEGKAAVADGMRGVVRSLAGPVVSLQPAVVPYDDVARCNGQPAASDRQDVIFITARFRSGSTLLWNLFRQLPGMTAYYEPLNERRWFDPAARGSHVDATHRGVDDYWREYEGLESLRDVYQPNWTSENLYLDREFWDPRLKTYIATLIERAAGRPVLQFNRVDFRLPWLRRHFPRAQIVHLYRHPRDQWCSIFVKTKPFPPHGSVRAFAPHDEFYLLAWARDLKYHFPFLDEREITHPYELHYYLWKLSYLFGSTYAQYSVAFEKLIQNPREELANLLGHLAVADWDLEPLQRVLTQPRVGRWRDYADAAWFAKYEERCERNLADFLELGTRNPSRASL